MKNTILNEAISLPVNQRAELIEILIKSLNPAVDKKIEELWLNEAEQRAKDIKKRKIKTVPAYEVMSSIQGCVISG